MMRTSKRQAVMHSVFILCLTYLIAGNVSAGGILTPDDSRLGIDISSTSDFVFDAGTRELTWSGSGLGTYEFLDGGTYRELGISSMAFSLTAIIGMDGRAESGSFVLTGGVPDLSVSDGSTLFSGDVFDSIVTDEGLPGDMYTLDVLMNPVVSEASPIFDNISSLGIHFFRVDGGIWPDTNIFDSSFVASSPTFVSLYETDMVAVPEPGSLYLFVMAALVLPLFSRARKRDGAGQ